MKDKCFGRLQVLITIATFLASLKVSCWLGNGDQFKEYIFFELTLFICFFIDSSVVVFIYRKRAITYQNNIIIIALVAFSIFGAISSIYSCPDNAFETILTLMSVAIGFPTILEFIKKHNLELMPMILSHDIKYDKLPIIDLSRNTIIFTKIKNFNNTDVSAAFLGMFNKSQWKDLKKKTSIWRTDYYFKNLGLNDGILLSDPIKYEDIPSFGESKTIALDLTKLLKNIEKDANSEFYLVYVDIFYKLHAVKFKVTNVEKAEFKKLKAKKELKNKNHNKDSTVPTKANISKKNLSKFVNGGIFIIIMANICTYLVDKSNSDY